MLSQAQFHRREAPKPPLRTSRRSPQNVLKPMCKCVPEQICSLVFDHMYVSSAVRHRQKFGNKYCGKKYGRGCAKVKMCLWNLHARHCAPQEAGEEKVELPSSPGQETIRDFHLTKTKKHKCRIFLWHSETMPNLRSKIFVMFVCWSWTARKGCNISIYWIIVRVLSSSRPYQALIFSTRANKKIDVCDKTFTFILFISSPSIRLETGTWCCVFPHLTNWLKSDLLAWI